MNNIVSVLFDKLLKFCKFAPVKRTLSGDPTDSDFDEFSVLKNDFGLAFLFLILSMNMDRFVFIGVEQDCQAEILIKFAAYFNFNSLFGVVLGSSHCIVLFQHQVRLAPPVPAPPGTAPVVNPQTLHTPLRQ